MTHYTFATALFAKYRIVLKACLFSPALIFALPLSAQPQQSAAELAWVARENLPEDLLALCPRSCSGMYVEPDINSENSHLNPSDAGLEIISDLFEANGQENISVMQGDVELIQGWRQVEADQVKILQDEERIEMTGDIQLREPGMLITGRAASIENTTQTLEFEDAEYVLHDLGVRGTAEELGRDGEGRFYVLNATYSTCEPNEDHWSLSAEEITIDENQIFATARNMTIRVGNVPIFYAPRFTFPVGEGRQTGLLYPVISQSGDNGLDITQPLYLNLAPNYDLTLAPRFIEERGAGIELEARYLNSYSFNQTNFSFLPDDKGGNDNSEVGENRWLFGLSHQGNWGDFYSQIDFNRASDTRYFEDLGSATQEINTQTYLKQFAQIGHNWDNWLVSASVLNYQTIAEEFVDTYEELPKVSLDGNYSFGKFDLELAHEIVNFDHSLDDVINSAPILQADVDGTWVTGQRVKIDYSLSRQFNASWGPVVAEGLSMFRTYQLDEALSGFQDTDPNIQATGLRLYSETNFDRSLNLFGKNWIQTLQPSIQYLYLNTNSQTDVPTFDTRLASPSFSGLFRTNEFVGGDRVNDANKITLAVSSRIIEPSNNDRSAHFSIGQSFYFEEREVHANELIQSSIGNPENFSINDVQRLLALEAQSALTDLQQKHSNLIAEAAFNLNSQWSITTDIHLNTSNQDIERGHINLSYLGSDQLSAYNLSYRFASDQIGFRDTNNDNLIQSEELFEGDTSQYDLSAVHAISNDWTLVARWQYDQALERSLEQLVGARYDSCCWSMGFYWREWLRRDDDLFFQQNDLRRDSGIFISFELKGLAGVGQSIETLLEKGIPGYKRENF